jgi:hypothetical protein
MPFLNRGYRETMEDQPTAFQPVTLTNINAILGPVGAGLQLAGTVTNLSGSYAGAGQQSQASQASGLIGKGQQVVTAINQAQQIINAGAQQLQAAKARLVALTKAAVAEGFVVTPVGTVQLGPRHIARINALRASERWAELKAYMKYLTGRKADYETQFNLVVLQSNMADAQVALTLANSVAGVLGTLMQKDQGDSTPQTGTAPPAVPPSTVPPSTGTPITPVTGIAGGTPPLTGAGSGLAAAGGAGLTGGFTGPAGLNPAALGGPGGTAGLGGAPIAPRGMVPEMAVGGGAAGSGMFYPGMPMAGGYAGEGREERNGNEWLEEDGEYETADAATEAGGVLA